jgi:hypothetical protein
MVKVLVEGERGYFSKLVEIERSEFVKSYCKVYGVKEEEFEGVWEELGGCNRRWRMGEELRELVGKGKVLWERNENSVYVRGVGICGLEEEDEDDNGFWEVIWDVDYVCS